MPANTSPIFTLTPNMGTARIVTATTASDGPPPPPPPS